MEEFEQLISSNKNTITTAKAKEYNSLVFAFVGDSVYTMFIRTYLVKKSTAQAGKLHTLTNGYVQASAQAKVYDKMLDILTEGEAQIARTARNAKTKTPAKNASLEDYKKATSFEAVLGHLYLTNQTARLNELLQFSLKVMEK